MKRVIILVLDSFGIGASQDAAAYGDEGADTLGAIAEACAAAKADMPGVRQGPLFLPHLVNRGLARAAMASTGRVLPGLDTQVEVDAYYGYALEKSRGKDTPSGHWEMMGLPVDFDWHVFPQAYPSFPQSLLDDLIQEAGLSGVLGNVAASGTDIIESLGEEHMATGKPIVYTSADSVFQIAAHEESFGLERLYAVCEITRRLLDPYNVGRVIARPFIGQPGHFQRTARRRDYSVLPHKPTLLDALVQAGREVFAVGKIADIFAHRGISQEIKGEDNADLFNQTLKVMDKAGDGSLIFTNFVDFDSKYGHRRDITGYAIALEAFDRYLIRLDAKLQEGDLVILTADHGCDPSFPGSDHTREHIPFLAYGKGIQGGFIGRRESFADIGQSVAAYLGLPALDYGISIFS